MPITLAIDIGGTNLKMMKVDDQDKPVGERSKKPTPRPATPLSVVKCIKSMLPEQGQFDRVSVGFPGVVREGVIKTAPNLDNGWSDFELQKALAKITNKPVRVLNDADMQGYGLVSGKGFELVITLGTGMGFAMFKDGQLLPHLEFGHHPFKNKKSYEDFLGKRGLEKQGKKKWNAHLQEAIELLRRIFNFDRLYIGGGNSDKITFEVPKDVILSKNIAGLLGGLKLWQ